MNNRLKILGLAFPTSSRFTILSRRLYRKTRIVKNRIVEIQRYRFLRFASNRANSPLGLIIENVQTRLGISTIERCGATTDFFTRSINSRDIQHQLRFYVAVRQSRNCSLSYRVPIYDLRNRLDRLRTADLFSLSLSLSRSFLFFRFSLFIVVYHYHITVSSTSNPS